MPATSKRLQLKTGRRTRSAHEIARAEARLISLPLKEPAGDAIQTFSSLQLPFVFLTDGDDNVGIGFGYTIGQGGSTILELLRQELLEKVVGQDSRRISRLHEQLTHSIHALTPGCIASNALAAIDIALWDLLGKRTNLPLHLLLGGSKDKVPLYNTDVGWLSRSQAEMAELCRQAVERDGFRAVKLKVGKPDGAEDEERIAKVRAAVGSHVAIMIDANQAWTLDEAIGRLKRLEKYAITWIEEPLPATDLQGLEGLGKHISIPRAGGESLYHPSYFYECLRRGALDILQPDVVRTGGITSAMKVCAMAAAAGVRVAPHVSPELSLPLAAAIPNSFYVEYIPQMEPILREKIRIEEGFGFPSDRPGHGILFDEEALNDYQTE